MDSLDERYRQCRSQNHLSIIIATTTDDDGDGAQPWWCHIDLLFKRTPYVTYKVNFL